jgi:hypothetical protein
VLPCDALPARIRPNHARQWNKSGNVNTSRSFIALSDVDQSSPALPADAARTGI